MSEFRVASRYAKSLIDLAQERNILEAIFSDIQLFAKTLENSHELLGMLKSPIINGDKKMAVMKMLFDRSFNPLTTSFLEIIVRKNRERYLGTIAQAFIAQYNELNNIIEASIKTAVETDESIKQQIRVALEKETGKRVNLKSSVDASLIGGIVVQVEDKLFDASIAGKLRQAKKQLLNTYISK
ncbi:MAG: ATP synthase F1 subunit delta [Bacteroidetes bacterium]|nr:ATP synthase F1 subunit delta [Bacteroidota bacterium]